MLKNINYLEFKEFPKYYLRKNNILEGLINSLPDVISNIIVEYDYYFSGIYDRKLIGHLCLIKSITTLSDSRILSVGGSIYKVDNVIRVWDPNTGYLLSTIEPKIPDYNFLILNDDNIIVHNHIIIEIYDTKTGTQIIQEWMYPDFFLELPDYYIYNKVRNDIHMVLSLTNGKIIIGLEFYYNGDDYDPSDEDSALSFDSGPLYLWDPGSRPKRIYGDNLIFLDKNLPKRILELSDGKFAVVYDYHNICIFDSNKDIDQPEFIIENIKWKDNEIFPKMNLLNKENLIFNYEDELTLVNLNTRKITLFNINIWGVIDDIILIPNNKIVGIGSYKSKIFIFDIETSEIKYCDLLPNNLYFNVFIGYLPNMWIVIGSKNKNGKMVINILDITKCKIINTIETEAEIDVLQMSILKDGRIIYGKENGNLEILK